MSLPTSHLGTSYPSHHPIWGHHVPPIIPFGDIMSLPSFHLGTSCPSHHPIWGHHVPPIIPFGDIMSLPSSRDYDVAVMLLGRHLPGSPHRLTVQTIPTMPLGGGGGVINGLQEG